MLPDRHILSRPHPVLWAGFRSDTRTLQQAGWEFSASQQYENDNVGLVMRHGVMGIHAVTDTVPNIMYDRHPQDIQQFQINYLTDRGIRYRHFQMPPWLPTCKPVDMIPQLVEVKSLEDMQLFAGCLARTQEIIVDPDDVSAMMERILTLQKPGAQEYYAEQLRKMQEPGQIVKDVRPQQQVHAQIISLVA